MTEIRSERDALQVQLLNSQRSINELESAFTRDLMRNQSSSSFSAGQNGHTFEAIASQLTGNEWFTNVDEILGGEGLSNTNEIIDLENSTQLGLLCDLGLSSSQEGNAINQLGLLDPLNIAYEEAGISNTPVNAMNDPFASSVRIEFFYLSDSNYK